MARASQKKLTKRELREDPFMTTIAKSQVWVNKNSQKLFIGIIIIVAAVFVSVYLGRTKVTANEEAQFSLLLAQEKISENLTEEAMEMIRESADRYKGTTGAAESLLSLAQLKLNEKDYEGAIEAFSEFEKKYKNEPLLYEAALDGKAVTLENLKKFEEAAMVYDLLASKDKYGHLVPIALYNAGRCWKLANDTDKARVYFERVEKEFADSKLAKEASRELAIINLGN